jgi:putative ABC transport system permease protein
MHMPAHWVKVFREVWTSKTQSLLVILSIAVGVFAVGMTTNATQIIQRDMNEPYRATNPASATLYITPFEKELARAVEHMPEVAQAEPRRVETAQAQNSAGQWVEIDLNVVPDYENVRINRYSPVAGQRVPDRNQILLERMTADYLGVSIGDAVTVRLPGGQRTYDLVVTGIVHDMHKLPPQWLEVGTGYVAMRTLWWMGAGTHYNVLNLVVADNPTDKEHILQVVNQARDRVIEKDGYYEVVGSMPFRGEPGTHYFSSDISAVLIILMAIGTICILLGAGLVINTSSALIARQVRQIGIIRSVGGLGSHIAMMYFTSIAIFSLLALLVAVPLGLVGARGMATLVGQQLNFDVTQVNLPLSVALLQIAVGLLVPLGAASVPILSGARMTVYDAIYQDGNITSVKKGIIAGLLKRLRGLDSLLVLAVRNAFRRKVRLAFTLSTLTLAGATFIAAFTTHHTLREQIMSINRYYLFDVTLDVPGGAHRRVVEREALREPDVQIAEAWYTTNAQIVFADESESQAIEAMALPPSSVTLEPELVAGRWLQDGDTNAVVVNEDLVSQIPDLRVGSRIALRVGGTDFHLKRRQMQHEYMVVGVVSRHILGTRIYAPYEYFTRVNDAQDQANVVRVRSDVGALQDGDAQQDLAARLEQRFADADMGGGSTATQYALVASNTGNFDMLLSVLLLMSGLLALVGGLGLTGTMSLNVLERTREIGVLRAVGASNVAVRRVVLFEGMVVAVISWALGAVLALPFGMALTNAISAALLNAEPDVQFSTMGMGLWLALVLGVATLASLIPARRASRLTVREVLAYE